MSNNKVVSEIDNSDEVAKKYRELEELSIKVESLDGAYKVIHKDYIIEGFKVLSGRILTIIDAVIEGERQNKNTKDLVKSVFYHEINDVESFYDKCEWRNSINLDEYRK